MLLALVCGDPAAAETLVEGRVTEGRFLQFVLPGIRSLVVGDAQGRLALTAAPAAERPWLACLLELDRTGNFATGEPQALTLPATVGEAAAVGEPVAVIFHPEKPLLYLWRRRGASAGKVADFAHLVVFDITPGKTPAVLATACKGESFQSEELPARLALDKRVRRLYLPNLRWRKEDNSFGTAVGYISLDAEGLPVVKPDKTEAVTVVSTGDMRRTPCGWTLTAIGNRILLGGAWRGFLYWDTSDRRSAMNSFSFKDTSRDDVGITADGRRIYVATIGYNELRNVGHVDGFPSLLPDALSIPETAFRSAPVLMTGEPPALAVVGNGKLHIVGLNGDGSFNRENQELAVPKLAEYVPLAYSSRFGRLYLPLEGWP